MTWQLDQLNHDKYLAACRAGITDFRRNEAVQMIIENSSMHSGQEYYELLHIMHPGIMEYKDRFLTSDWVGNPEKHYIGKDFWSPTTLRYIKTLSDLVLHFGSLDGMRIAEIGAGYGGLQKVIYDVFTPKSYTRYDLDEAFNLQYEYLAEFDIYDTDDDPPFDLIIACSSWSELWPHEQRRYMDVIGRSARGYFQLNYDIDFSLGLLKEWKPDLIMEDVFYNELPSEHYEPFNKITIC